MSFIAGIYYKDPGDDAVVSPADAEALRKAVASAAAAEPEIALSGRACFAKVDYGIHRQRAFSRSGSGDLAMLAGFPLLSEPDTQDRALELDLLAKGLADGDDRRLRGAVGSFCGAFFRAAEGALDLVADKAALRPIYYYEDAKRVVFSSLLKVIEGLDLVPKRMDLRGVTETATWGVPLADRTAYAGIRTVVAGHRLRFARGRREDTAYWRWQDVDQTPVPEEELRPRVAAALRRAVERRLGDDRAAFAFLSGGLDSRSVAAFLRERGVEVHSLNFAPAGTLDAILGAEFAAKSGCRHTAVPPPGRADAFLDMLRRTLDTRGPFTPAPERPGLIWDGGGTGTTLVVHRITDKAAALFREGKRAEGVRDIIRANNMDLPASAFSPEAHRRLSGVLFEGVMEEMDKMRTGDPVRDFQVFMIHSYEGKHYHAIFEDLPGYRMELVQPFFDWSYVETCFRIPVERAMWHRFYVPLLAEFPPVVSQVPWQAYPLAPPCPLPLPRVPHQWAKDNPYQVADRLKWRKSSWKLLGARNFAPPLFRTPFLLWSVFADTVGYADYRYVFKFWQPFAAHHRVSRGEMVWP